MRKSFKGAIAAGVAGIVLLSGYGSYALWSDTESLNGGTVNSGELKLENAVAGTWADISDGAPGTAIADINDFLIVPGDVLTYTASAEILAKGDNLEATLTADPASITGDAELLADVAITTDVQVAGAAATTITEANDGQTVDVVVTLTFDEGSLNPTQLQSLDLAGLELVLAQNPR